MMKGVKEKYGDVGMMVWCGGGGGCEYEGLKYLRELWWSEKRDGVERGYMEWGFCELLGGKGMCGEVRRWNKNSCMKLGREMGWMCKVGFDMGLKEMGGEEVEYWEVGVGKWKGLEGVILDGVEYGVVWGYECKEMGVKYVREDGWKGVVFG